jgi:uncharacterized membrane protein
MRVVSLAILAFLSATGPAFAGLTVCNRSALPARVALGRFDGKDWTSQGWWTLKPKDCRPLLTGPLKARYYYLYATDGAAGTWDGKKSFCTAPHGGFTIPGRGSCASRGYDRKGFFEIDTGRKSDWTQTLSD